MPRRHEITPQTSNPPLPRPSGEFKITSKKVNLLFILLFFSVVFFVWSVYHFKVVAKNTSAISAQLDQQSIFSKRGSEQLISKVGRLILLPQNEKPSVATINNVTQLQKTQPFYKDARNGDLLLLYFKAQKAYIYSVSRNIIVNVGPLILEKNNADNTPASVTSTP